MDFLNFQVKRLIDAGHMEQAEQLKIAIAQIEGQLDQHKKFLKRKIEKMEENHQNQGEKKLEELRNEMREVSW